jgi:hypothetical protein
MQFGMKMLPLEATPNFYFQFPVSISNMMGTWIREVKAIIEPLNIGYWNDIHIFGKYTTFVYFPKM